MTKLLGGAGIAALVALAAPAMAQDQAPPPPQGEGPPPAPKPIARADVAAMVQRQFERIDANHDGIVTRAEFDAFEQARRTERMARMKERRDREFAQLDANHDNQLSRNEFDAGMPPPGGPEGAAPPPGAGMEHGHPGHMGPRGPMGGGMLMGPHWFERADANHDGQVTLAEAQAAALAMFDRMDVNHDGVLTPDERRPTRPEGPGAPGGDMPPPPPQDQ